MTAKFYAILTNQGAARLANAAALGTKLNLTQMGVGDANGKLPTPDAAQTKLINQQHIAPLNMLSVDPKNTSQIIAEQIIPENEGGWWIREIGLYDDAGVLIAVANCPETYKPLLQEGSGRTQTIRMLLIVSSAAAITLKIDPAVVLATRQYVDDGIIEVKAYTDKKLTAHEQSRNHPDGTLAAKGFVQLNSSVESTSEQLAATPKAVKITMDNASARLAKERNLADLPNPALARQNLSLKSAAQADIQTDKNDQTPGKAIAVGGAIAVRSNVVARTGGDIDDVNSLPANSISFAHIDAKNSPGYTGTLVSVSGFGNNEYSLQIMGAYHSEGKQIGFRTYDGDRKLWNTWNDFYHRGDKPTAQDVGALPLSGGVLGGSLEIVGDDQTLIMRPSVMGRGYYLFGKKFDGSNHFYFGQGSNDKDDVTWGVCTTDTHISQKLDTIILKSKVVESTGEIIGSAANNFRIAYGSYGAFWRNDGVRLYLMLTDKGDPLGKYNNYRPFEVELATGDTTIGKLQLLNYSNFDSRYAKIAENYPVGAPIPWPQSAVPAGFLLCNGQKFNKTTYPLLATAYPLGALPDLRGEFIRGLDAGRGVDSGRTVLSAQGDAIRKITGKVKTSAGTYDADKITGAFKLDSKNAAGAGFSGNSEHGIASFDSSRVVPTANENRPRNVAFSYIVRAA